MDVQVNPTLDSLEIEGDDGSGVGDGNDPVCQTDQDSQPTTQASKHKYNRARES